MVPNAASRNIDRGRRRAERDALDGRATDLTAEFVGPGPTTQVCVGTCEPFGDSEWR